MPRIALCVLATLAATESIAASSEWNFAEAIRGDNVTLVAELLEKEAELIDYQDRRGESALHIAAKGGHLLVLEELLRHGARVDIKSNEGLTPAHFAALFKRTTAFVRLLEAGSDPSVPLPSGERLIHIAAQSGCLTCLQALIEAGANIDEPQTFGKTPLHIASEMNNPLLIKELVNAGANARLVDKNGSSALHFAARYPNKDVISKLISAGANPNRVNGSGFTPFLVAIAFGQRTNIENLVNDGLDLSIEVDGDTALLMAARLSDTDLIGALINIGAHTDDRDSQGFSSIYFVARTGNLPATQLLLDAGVPLDHLGSSDTPLHAASRGNHIAVVKILISAGARPVIRNQYIEDIFATGVSSLYFAEHVSASDPGLAEKYYAIAENNLKVAEDVFRSASDEFLKRYKSDKFWSDFASAAGAAVGSELQRMRTAPQRRQLAEVMALSDARSMNEYFVLNSAYQEAMVSNSTVLPTNMSVSSIDTVKKRDDLLAGHTIYKARANAAMQHLERAVSARAANTHKSQQ